MEVPFLWSISAEKANINNTTRRCVNNILRAGSLVKPSLKNGKWKLRIISQAVTQADLKNLAMKSALEGLFELTVISLNSGENIYSAADLSKIQKNAAVAGNLKLVKYIYDQFGNHDLETGNVLIAAAEKGRLRVVKYLIKKFQYTYRNNAQELSRALFVASCYGRLKVVMFLIDNFEYDKGDVNGSLIGASYSGQLNIVKYLVMKGADIHCKIHGQSPLDEAASQRHFNIVRFLLEAQEEG